MNIISISGQKGRLRGQKPVKTLKSDPCKVYFGHLVVVILEFVHAQVVVDVAPVFTVPDLHFTKLTLPWNQDPKRASQIFDRLISIQMLFKAQFG